MEKQVQFFGKTDTGIFCQTLFGSAGAFEKTAGAPAFSDWETGDAIRKYIAGITKEDRQKYCYVLVNALGAGEYFGSNINADYFPWNSLTHEGDDYGYKTFLKAHAYAHHVNKDPTRAFGIPVLSLLNHKMKRVELIVRLDRVKAKLEGHDGIITRIDAGEFPDVSMGCKVPYDVCSKCHNQSKTRDDYCEHMRPPEHLRGIYGPNKILQDGSKIYVINLHPRFFDISFVFIGADKTAKVMAKIASKGNMICMGDVCTVPRISSEVYELTSGGILVPESMAKTASVKEPCCTSCGDFDKISSAFQVKTSAKKKLSEIIKQVPAGTFAMRKLKVMESSEPTISTPYLDSMALGSSLPEILGSALLAGIIFKPEEFQRLVLRKMAEDEIADRLFAKKEVFKQSKDYEKVALDFSSPTSMLPFLSSVIEKRAAFGKHFDLRVATSPEDVKIPLPTQTAVEHPLLDKVAAAYNGYRREVLLKLSQAVEVIQSDPQLRDAVIGSDLVNMFMKTANSSLLSLDSVTYMMGAHFTDRALLSNTAVADAIADHNPRLLSEGHLA